MNDNITEINKDTFWALIQEAKDTKAILATTPRSRYLCGPQMAQPFPSWPTSWQNQCAASLHCRPHTIIARSSKASRPMACRWNRWRKRGTGPSTRYGAVKWTSQRTKSVPETGSLRGKKLVLCCSIYENMII